MRDNRDQLLAAIDTRFAPVLRSPYYLVAAVLDPHVAHTLTSEQLREGVALV
jgi:hypothetical protein